MLRASFEGPSIGEAGSMLIALTLHPRTSMAALPVPRFDTFYRHEELSQLLHDYAAAAPGLVRVASIGKSHEGPRHLGRHRHQLFHRRRHRQAGVLGRRQHPRRRAQRQHGLPVLPAPARRPVRQRPRHHAAARHARGLPVPAPEPRRRRAGAGRQAAPHPLIDAALPLRRRRGRGPDGRGRGRRRPHADDARARPARRVQEAPAGARG